MNVQQHKARVAAMRCLICGAEANLHHPRFCVGMGQRASDWLVIPLCKAHHQDNPYGHAVHSGYQEFAKNYMSEEEMLAEVIKRL